MSSPLLQPFHLRYQRKDQLPRGRSKAQRNCHRRELSRHRFRQCVDRQQLCSKVALLENHIRRPRTDLIR